MQKLAAVLRKEIQELIPPTIFFFIAFNIIAFTSALNLRQYGISVLTFAMAALGALVAGKAVLITDKLSFTNRFPDKPQCGMEDTHILACFYLDPVPGTPHPLFVSVRKPKLGKSPSVRGGGLAPLLGNSDLAFSPSIRLLRVQRVGTCRRTACGDRDVF